VYNRKVGFQWQVFQPIDFDQVMQHLFYVGQPFANNQGFAGIFVFGSHGTHLGNMAGLTANRRFPIGSGRWGIDAGATLFFNYDPIGFMVMASGGVSFQY
jgi:hypothetical protein